MSSSDMFRNGSHLHVFAGRESAMLQCSKDILPMFKLTAVLTT